jgi:O-antigen ligase
MSIAAGVAQAGHQQRTKTDLERAAYRVRLTKIACGVALGVGFWFSVPYTLPYLVEHADSASAAAKAAAAEGNISRQLAVPLMGIVAALMLWRLPRRGRFGGWLGAWILTYLAWSFLSVAWSIDPSITMKRMVVFGFDALFAYTLARRLSVMELAALGVAATGAVAALAFYGDFALQHIFAPGDPEYRFQGVTTANYQAMSLVVLLVCIVTLFDRKPRWRMWLSGIFLAGFALLVLTRARMSTILCMMLMVIMLTRIAKRQMKASTRAMVLVAGLMVALPVAVYVVGNLGGSAAQQAFMMGRNDTENTSNLSNRGPLWAELWESVQSRPLLGTGYAAFWSPARIARISADQGWPVPHAHDTYLDQTLSLGLVGAVLYTGMLWGACVIAWKRYRRDRSAVNLFSAVLLLWLALQGITESAPLDPYLPSILAYSCVVKMAMVEGSEAESDVGMREDEVIGGQTLANLPLQEAADVEGI